MDIANLRLTSQHIASADFATAKDVVSHMAAMQAQDYHGALWAIALRTPGLTKKDVEQAIIDRHIVRTWPMRGTLHFLAAEDARWVTALLAPRAIAMSAGRLRQLELDETVLKRAEELIVRALNGGNCLTRTELCDMLDKNAIISAGQRGLHTTTGRPRCPSSSRTESSRVATACSCQRSSLTARSKEHGNALNAPKAKV
jgi:hypothetical protein